MPLFSGVLSEAESFYGRKNYGKNFWESSMFTKLTFLCKNGQVVCSFLACFDGVFSSARNIFPIGISTGENLRVQVLRGRFFSKDDTQIIDYSVCLFLMRVMFMISCSGVSLAAKFMLKFWCMCGSIFSLSLVGKSME